MSLVFAAACSHGPGITGRAHLAEPTLRDAFHAEFRALGESLVPVKLHRDVTAQLKITIVKQA